MKKHVLLLLAALLFIAPAARAQQSPPPTPTQVIIGPPSGVVMVPISATNSVNTQTVLTIPATAGMFNYVCYLAYQANADATGAAITNAVTTSSNFNSFAVKFSQVAGVNLDSGVQPLINSMGALGGCVKSTLAGTATTFTSTSGLTHEAWTWYAVYYQWPF